ncbi:MAG TPA: hypothetical protein VK982_01220, partial [Bacteroidales bacterium]|nr:hypothetical protein [Bacteroidales bacterium]
MKIGINRQELETELRKAIYEILTTKKTTDEVVNKLMRKGYMAGEINSILNGNTLLEFLSLIDLGVLTNAIYETISLEKIN